MTDELCALLERVALLQDEKAAAEAAVKEANKRLEEVERLAVEALAASGLDGVRAAGKSWNLRETFFVNIPAENRDEVLRVAQEECPELVSVNTTTLKSWLVERRRDLEDGAETLADGTPFAGLVKEYRETRLSSRRVG